MWFFFLFGAILPDADFLLDWIIGTSLHRTFTHSLLFVVAAALLVYFIFGVLKNKERRQYAFAIGAGILTHLFFDSLSLPGIPLVWPGTLFFSWQGIGSINLSDYALFSHPEALLKLAILDMGLGIAWLFYLWYKKRVTF